MAGASGSAGGGAGAACPAGRSPWPAAALVVASWGAGARGGGSGANRVLQASNGLEALEIFREKKSEIELVVMDLIMPEMDGSETFGELRKIDPNVKIVLCSGYSKDEKVDALLGDGAEGFVQKPFDAAALWDEIDN